MRHADVPARGHRAVGALALVAAVLVVSVFPAHAEAQRASARVRRMTTQAMWAYQHLEIERAQRLLERALGQARRARVRGRTLAEVHMALGVVAAGGFGDATAAEEAFIEAIFLDPDVELDRMVSNPSIERAFRAARLATSVDEPSPLEPEAVAAAAPAEPSPPPPPVVRPARPAPATPARRTRFFVRAGYTAGTAMARQGGIADRGVPFHPAHRPPDWDEAANGVYAPEGYATEAEWYAAMAHAYQGFTENPDHVYELVTPVTIDGVSVDEGPLRPDPACRAAPGELCVRLRDEGLVFVSALDVEVGYRVLPRFSVSLGLRIGFPAGEGTLARALLTGRVEIPLTRTIGRGFRVLALGGVGMGQIQLPIPQGPGLVEPFIATGLGNIDGAMQLGYAFSDHLGMFARPTIHVLFPRSVRVYELTVGGETSF
jgi:hypothetical protein